MSNARLDGRALDALTLTAEAERLLRTALEREHVTGRGFDRVRRLARTIADLDAADVIDEARLAEALVLRGEA